MITANEIYEWTNFAYETNDFQNKGLRGNTNWPIQHGPPLILPLLPKPIVAVVVSVVVLVHPVEAAVPMVIVRVVRGAMIALVLLKEARSKEGRIVPLLVPPAFVGTSCTSCTARNSRTARTSRFLPWFLFRRNISRTRVIYCDRNTNEYQQKNQNCTNESYHNTSVLLPQRNAVFLTEHVKLPIFPR